MVRYTITRWDSRFSMKARSFEECTRSDRAQTLLWDAIYAMLDSESLRDRPVAVRLLKEFNDAVGGGHIQAPPQGSYRQQEFMLNVDNPKVLSGPYVEFRAHRMYR